VVNDPTYIPTRWQGTLLIIASVIGIGLFNVFAAKHLPLAEGIFVTFHVFAFFPIIIVLLVLSPKQSAHDVFLNFTDNGGGWPNVGWATLVGQVSTMFVVLGSDSVAHMAEEIEDAGLIVPKSMVWTFLLNVPFTFGLLLTYLFCIGDVTQALASSTGFPFIYVFQNATGSVGGTTGMTIVILLLLIMITISSMASTSRQTFAFARDNGLPFSKWLGHVSANPFIFTPPCHSTYQLTQLAQVHDTWHIPVNSIIFTCAFTIVMSLINIGSTVAFNAILSLSTVALMATYVISVGCVTLKRLRREPLPDSRWTLGRWGLPINVTAFVYAIWSFFWSFWPNSMQVTAVNFNWACVLFVGLMGISGVLYAVHARKVYEGPVVKVEGRKFN
jgi:choline transport protein